VSEFMRDGKIGAPFRVSRLVVDDAPFAVAMRDRKQHALESFAVFHALDFRDGGFRENAAGELPGDFPYIDREAVELVRVLECIDQPGQAAGL